MNRRRAALSLLALATALAGKAMAASPREGPQYFEDHVQETAEAQRTRKAAAMEAWLRRMVGRFREETPVWDESGNVFRRMVDCVGIGAGPGLHCIHYTTKPQAAGQHSAGKQQQTPDTQLHASEVFRIDHIVEYGMDPNASRIRMAMVHPQGAQLLTGWLSDDGSTLTLTARCWNAPASGGCEFEQKMEAPADSRDIWVRGFYQWQFMGGYTLRRMSQDEAEEATRMIDAGARPASGKKGGRPR